MAKAASPDRPTKSWLTVDETAQILGLSPMTLYRAIAAKQFPAVKFGRRICVPAEALNQLASAALEAGSLVDSADWREVLMTG